MRSSGERGDQLAAAAYTELVEHGAEMFLNGVGRDVEFGFSPRWCAVAALMLFAVSNDLFNIIRDMKIFGIG